MIDAGLLTGSVCRLIGMLYNLFSLLQTDKTASVFSAVAGSILDSEKKKLGHMIECSLHFKSGKSLLIANQKKKASLSPYSSRINEN